MPTLKKPTSDSGRIILLDNIVLTGNQDNAAGNNYVQQATLDEIAVYLPDFKSAESTVKEKSEDKMKEVREKSEGIRFLEINCRDMWAGVKRRKTRMGHPDEILTYYGLPLDGKIPQIDAPGEWLKTAADMIEGDARAVADGFPTMLNPSATEMQEALDKAKDEFDDFAMADREHDQAQAAVAALRPQADEFINEVYDQLTFALRKMDNPSQRRVIRTYGYKYEYSPGEPPEEPPVKPENFTAAWEHPDLTLSCNPVPTATGYMIEFSVDEENWEQIYEGEENSLTYQPLAGNRFYRMRAYNDYDNGEWSDVISFEPPVV